LGEAIVFEMAAGLAEGDDLGVGGGVVIAEDAVLAAGDDFAVVDNDRADGDFAVVLSCMGLGDTGVEVVEIVRHS
jgi:hypothetical protein